MDKNDIIEYVMYTPHNTNRAVLSSMLNQLTEGGGDGDSWTTLTEESVTTEDGGSGLYETSLEYSELITADSVKITFNSVEYTCTNISEESGEGAYGAEVPDWSTYPFRLESSESPFGGVINHIITETAGTYTIKIEAPQSGGSSDFSTAKVTVVNNTDSDVSTYGPVANIDDFGEMNISPQFTFSRGESFTILVMHKQHTYISLNTNATITVEGSAEIDGPDVIITGDCTITVGQAASA